MGLRLIIRFIISQIYKFINAAAKSLANNATINIIWITFLYRIADTEFLVCAISKFNIYKVMAPDIVWSQIIFSCFSFWA